MEGDRRPDFGAFAVRQSDPSFRSPNIIRRNLGKEAVTAHSIRKARRAKSTEPTPLDSNDPFIKFVPKVQYEELLPAVDTDRTCSLTAKDQENMSKSELINCYRLLMNEKLRLERFLSIMSKNNEMARNRLESDLLDAMMCIEDLKQALELRMARRRKIDPREAEERRYLIRQNKKLLNQLYESAKKIERLELTKVEMKEQLELLDFQILEVENQKAMMEEELRRLPSCNHSSTQTESQPDDDAHLVTQLREQLNNMKTDFVNQKAEAAAMQARQQRLENLVRDLRRDNVDLRDQLAKLDDAENSLAESDKPLAAGTKMLQTQLEQQNEHVRELQLKLSASRDYIEQLEARIAHFEQSLPTEAHNTTFSMPSPITVQASMFEAMERATPGFRAPRVDDKLLQETIRTFQALLNERDQELARMKQHIRQHMNDLSAHEDCEVLLPQLFETAVQTDLTMEQAQKLATVTNTLAEGGLLLTYDQSHALLNEIYQCIDVMDSSTSPETDRSTGDQILGFTDLLTATNRLRSCLQQLQSSEGLLDKEKIQHLTGKNVESSDPSQPGSQCVNSAQEHPEQKTSVNNGKNVSRVQDQGVISDKKTVNAYPISSTLQSVSGRKPHSPEHYNDQLDELRQTSDLESVRAHLGVSERRRTELERRLLEITEELSRARAEARSSETSLAAARRTEAALRRRLLVAMDMQGSGTDPSSVRHSYSGTLNAGTEARDALELQAALIKAEATNAALTEAAQLDRSRLHEQAMRIGQFEAEHRALMDRISILQTTESNAQRGIVRLQALYEDMLREYSESRSQELNWRSRERSRSNYRQQQNEPKPSKPPVSSRTDPNLSKLQRQVHDLEAENRNLKQKLDSQNISFTDVTSHPVGPCASPACIEVRQLLKSFQDRFVETVGQAEQCLDFTVNGTVECPGVGNGAHANVRNVLVNCLRNKLGSLQHLLRHAESGLDSMVIVTEISTCNQLFARLDGWLQRYTYRTDSELAELRTRLMELQIASVEAEPTFVTSCAERSTGHPFSCSISLNKKPDAELLAQREEEILKLRTQLREVESELELRKAHSSESQVVSNRAD